MHAEPHSSQLVGASTEPFAGPPVIPGCIPVRPLGKGGSGEAWLVEQSRPFERRLVAKVFHPQPDAASMLARFERERAALSALSRAGASDPGLASIHDAGLTADGRPFVLMQFIDGKPIDEAARALPFTARMDLLRQCCIALMGAHGAGLVHQDITPRNVLVSTRPDGSRHVTLIDFGLAASTGTRAMLQGTPDWMAPEQSVATGGSISPATDVWALGRMLGMLLEGVADDGARIDGTARGWLRELAEYCCAHEPSSRPRDAAAVLAQLDAILGHAAHASTPQRRSRLTRMVLVSVPLLGIAGVVLAALNGPRWREIPNDATDVVARDFADAAGLALPDGWEPRNRGVGRWVLKRADDGARVLVGEGTDGAHAQVAVPLSRAVEADEPFWLEWTMRARPPVESSGRRDESDLLVILTGARHQLTIQPQREALVFQRSACSAPALPAAREELPALGFAQHEAWVRFRIARVAGPVARYTVERTDLASGARTVAELTLPDGPPDAFTEILLAVQERQPLEISGLLLAQRVRDRAP